MRASDIADALQLCRTSGWNQLRADWLRLIQRDPEGSFVAEVDGRLAGTVTTIHYKDQLAWIGMMLVGEAFRRRGIATKLMNASLQHLESLSIQCVKLDATPLGQPVYEHLGFRSEWSFHRWRRQQTTASGFKRVESGIPRLSGAHFEIDREVFGADRSDWLKELHEVSNVAVRDDGFGMLRHGHVADYLGPVVAPSVEVAMEIVGELLSHPTGETVFWDLPHLEEAFSQLPQSLGFEPVRDLTRMWRGFRLVPGQVENQFAIAEPATG